MTMILNLTRYLFFINIVNINVSIYAALKLGLVPASRYFCDVNWSYHNVCANFHLD